MSKPAAGEPGTRPICENRRARHEYNIDETWEAGIALLGSEVKSLRTGKVHLNEAYVQVVNGEAWLQQAHIAPYSHASIFNHEPDRRRKLLLHKSELRKLQAATREKGFTLIPLKLYFKGSRAKLLFGVGKGKKLHDKRADLKAADAKREMDRAMRAR